MSTPDSRKAGREHWRANRDKRLAQARISRLKNAEKRRVYQRAYDATRRRELYGIESGKRQMRVNQG